MPIIRQSFSSSLKLPVIFSSSSRKPSTFLLSFFVSSVFHSLTSYISDSSPRPSLSFSSSSYKPPHPFLLSYLVSLSSVRHSPTSYPRHLTHVRFSSLVPFVFQFVPQTSSSFLMSFLVSPSLYYQSVTFSSAVTKGGGWNSGKTVDKLSRLQERNSHCRWTGIYLFIYVFTYWKM